MPSKEKLDPYIILYVYQGKKNEIVSLTFKAGTRVRRFKGRLYIPMYVRPSNNLKVISSLDWYIAS